jgi:hypothetical protein
VLDGEIAVPDERGVTHIEALTCAALAGAPGQPTAITPIPVSKLSAAVPVQTQGYPHYFPEYYAGMSGLPVI